MALYVIWIIFTLVSAWLLTLYLRRYALKKSILDIPNERSSHSVVTPRGGGLAIVITFVINLLLLYFLHYLSFRVTAGIGVASLLIAVTGFIDDRSPIHSKARLIIHFLAAIWIVTWLGRIPPVTIFSYSIDLNWFMSVIAIVYLVWLLNLYNFMDGIDGIASVEAITVCFSGALILLLVSPDHHFWLLPVLLSVAVMGFLIWNWPPAKIFMGDVGSAFLGISIGAISLFSMDFGSQLIWSWVILLAVFIIDATVTLIRRLLRGDSFDQAHRNHAYQYASRKYGGHKKVTMMTGLINLFWLFPIACLVALNKMDGGIGILIAYTPLVLAAFRLHAGARERQMDFP